MPARAYLAIDLGAESGRAIVGVLDGDRLTLHESHRFFHLPRRLPSGLHWDLTGLWGEVLEGTRRAAAWARDQGLSLTSLGVDTWGVDYALLGRSGELLGLPHAYRDERNGPAFEKAIAAIGREALYEVTGIQFMVFNTLFQLVAARDADRELIARADKLLFMPDLLHYFFTSRAAVESSIASTSQMTDPRTGRWATGLLEQLDLPTDMLGPIVRAGTSLGPLLDDVAEEIGVDCDVQVITPAAHDTASAVAAVPADASTNWCYLSSGTWSLIGAELDQPCISDAAREVPFTNEGGVDGTIRFLKNINGLWLVQECRRHFQKQGTHVSYEELTSQAAAAEPFRTLIDTDHEPFASAGDMPEKIAGFARSTRQPQPDNVGQLIRCCLESLALTYRHTLGQLERVLDRSFDVLHLVGGGGRNRLLNQMTADALGRRVVVGPYEATATGNVLVQALGAGHVSDRAHIRRIVANTFEPEVYEPRETEAWDQAYERFVDLLTR
jgi:rhamnulokinase